MDLVEEEQRRECFISLLYDLAASQEILKGKEVRENFCLKLEKIYYVGENQKPFRHFYSDIFSVLTTIKRDVNLGDINILGQNIKVIRQEYQERLECLKSSLSKDEEVIDISDSIRKLEDHISLDIARMEYSDSGDWVISQRKNTDIIEGKINKINIDLASATDNFESAIKDLESTKNEYTALKKEVDESEKKVSDTNTTLNGVVKDMEDMQKKYVTILGIFSSIVLAFTGGIAFSTSVLENMHKASSYRVVIVCLLIAFALLNTFFVLVFYLRKVWENGAKSKTEIWIVAIVNAVIVGGIIITCICWNNGLVENRNEDVKEDLNNRTSIVTEAQTESTTQALETLLETTGLAVPKN